MKHPERIEDYLDHISEAVDRATSYLEPLQTLGELQRNQQVQDAVVRNIEVIGEAATKIQKMADTRVIRGTESRVPRTASFPPKSSGSATIHR
jgi:uncharacterized protein with HEPN domain